MMAGMRLVNAVLHSRVRKAGTLGSSGLGDVDGGQAGA